MNKNIVLTALFHELKPFLTVDFIPETDDDFNKLNRIIDKMLSVINHTTLDKENPQQSLNSLFSYLQTNELSRQNHHQPKSFVDLKALNETVSSLVKTEMEWSIPTINLLMTLFKNELKDTPNHFYSKYNDISIVENALLRANLLVCLSEFLKEYRADWNEENILLQERAFLFVSFDFSGIQNFIFNIPSEGALRNLRSRSFYLEMMAENLTDQILMELGLTRAHVIYVGGGHGYLLLPNLPKTKAVVAKKIEVFNAFFLAQYDYKLYVSHAMVETNAYHLMNVDLTFQNNQSFQTLMSEVFTKISQNKKEKFNFDTLKRLNEFQLHDSERECSQCGKTSHLIKKGDVYVCQSCNQFSEFGKVIADDKKQFLVISHAPIQDVAHLTFPYDTEKNVYLSAYDETDYNKLLLHDSGQILISYVKNRPKYYSNPINHVAFVDKVIRKNDKQLTIDEIASLDSGIKRIAVLKLDVDSLGEIFKTAFPKEMYNLARMASLSQKLSFFFKEEIKNMIEELHLSIVFSGGDDVFVFGSLGDIITFSKKMYENFNEYTLGKLHFSGGIGIFTSKYPVYKMSDYVEDLLLTAKSTEGKNSVAIFDKQHVFKWNEFFHVLREDTKGTESYVLKQSFSKKLLTNTMLYNAVYKQLVGLESSKNPEKISYKLMYLLGRIKKEKKVDDQDNTFKELSQLIINAANIKQTKARKNLLLAIQIHLYKNREKEK